VSTKKELEWFRSTEAWEKFPDPIRRIFERSHEDDGLPIPSDYTTVVEFGYMYVLGDGRQWETSLGFDYYQNEQDVPRYAVGEESELNGVRVLVTDTSWDPASEEMEGIKYLSVTVEPLEES